MKPRYIKAQEIRPGDTIVWHTNGGIQVLYAIVSEVEEYENPHGVPSILVNGDLSVNIQGLPPGQTWFALEAANNKLTDILLVDRKEEASSNERT